jgi:hypothetical protein
MKNTKKRSRNCKLVVIYLNKSHRTFVHQKVSTILIEIKLYIDIHVYSNSKTLFSINLLLAISTMNFAALCLNHGVVTSVTIATMVVGSS